MLLFSESFDLYSNLSQKWDAVEYVTYGFTTYPQITPAAARNGPNGLQIVSQGGNHTGLQKNFSSRATYYVGFAFNALGWGGSAPLVGLWDGSTNQCEIWLNMTGNFQFFRNSGATALGHESTYALSFGCWHYIEVLMTINSTSGVCQLRVDGNLVLQLAGQNTQASGNASASGVIIGPWEFATAAVTFDMYIDDLVIYDNAGSYNNSFIGDVRVTAQVPSGNGSTNNYSQNAASWAASTVEAVGNGIVDSNGNLQRILSVTSDAKTGSTTPSWATTLGATTLDNHVTWILVEKSPLSNYAFVNEVPPDDNDTYLSDATVNDEDLYTFPSIAGDSVAAVMVNLRACKDDSSVRSIRALAKSGSTTADSGTDLPLSQNIYADYQGAFEVDPNTGLPWAISGVNAAQFGIKTTA